MFATGAGCEPLPCWQTCFEASEVAPAGGLDEVPSHALDELSQASIEDWSSRSPPQAEQPQRDPTEARTFCSSCIA